MGGWTGIGVTESGIDFGSVAGRGSAGGVSIEGLGGDASAGVLEGSGISLVVVSPIGPSGRVGGGEGLGWSGFSASDEGFLTGGIESAGGGESEQFFFLSSGGEIGSEIGGGASIGVVFE